MRETVVEAYLSTQAHNHDFLCYKFVSPGRRGVPDRILIGHGKQIFIETKAPGEHPRKSQIACITEMKKHGATVLVIDTKEKVDKLFSDLRKELNITKKATQSVVHGKLEVKPCKIKITK